MKLELTMSQDTGQLSWEVSTKWFMFGNMVRVGMLCSRFLTMISHNLDSYSERAGVRAKLAVDKEWQQEYFQKILPWLQHQDNLTMKRLKLLNI